ncbi:energy transducer TonB [Massilia sp. PWRC2]|uniref:energy transducer TonB n=1 Tax=Massilia sp. PWRC2 TaxID=2804626 RepID=UPI003CF4993B
MHFSDLSEKGGTKFSKLALVAALHVAIGALFIHTLNSRGVALPKMPEELIVMFTPEAPPPPPPPPEPPKPMPKTAPPQVIAPPVEVPVQQPPPPDAAAAVVSTETAPQPATSAVADPGPVAPAPTSGVMRTVALADASGCATPNYPVRAARNNESGTVTLALLVGTNGRVSDSRIKSSSGSRELDRAAIAALSTCTFKPAMNGGVAEPGWAQIAYVWTLE